GQGGVNRTEQQALKVRHCFEFYTLLLSNAGDPRQVGKPYK
ncbi:hypothetical protein PSYJA_44386, partial [Pseudomonas syringae pv. japonica str. M301072]